MKKGQVYEATVEKVDFPGRGIMHVEEYTVIVKNCLPGQKIRFRVDKARNGRAEGRLLEVLEHSPLESGRTCSHFGVCGGCAYLPLPYEEQLRLKEGQVKHLLDACLERQEEPWVWEGIKGSPAVFGYRNKMEFSFGDEVKDGPLALGMHRRGSFYDVVTVDECCIMDADYRLILRTVLDYFAVGGTAGERVSYFHRMRHEGYLRHLLVRKASRTGEILVVLVTTSQAPWGRGAGGEKPGNGQAEEDAAGRSETGGTEKSETGCAGKSETGCAGKSETGCTGRSETGGTEKSETGCAGQSETGCAGQSEAGGTGKSGMGCAGQSEAGGTGKSEMGGAGQSEAGGTGKSETGGAGKSGMGCAGQFVEEKDVREDLAGPQDGMTEEELMDGFRECVLRLERSGRLQGSLAGILHIVNDTRGDVVQSDRTDVLYGREYFYEELLGLKFKISTFSFFQTNTLGAEVLYETVREYVGDLESGRPDGGQERVVFDLYSGTGTIAQLMAPVADKVIGVEIVEEAVYAARKNAEENGLANCEFIAGDVLKVLDMLEEKPELIILDPPRDGIHPKALPKIGAQIRAERIVYISCKPTSLVRDLAEFMGYGYRVERACCVDMFPGTAHVETVCLLSNRKPDTKVRIDVDLEDYYRIKDAKKNQN